jgi:signal transduction histidine kinase
MGGGVRSERLDAARDADAAMRHVGQSVCHQVRSAMTVATMAADVAIAVGDPAKALEGLARVRDAALRVEPAVALYHRALAGEAVRPFSVAPGAEGADLAEAAAAAVELARHALARAGLEVRCDLAPAPSGLCGRDALDLALVLAANAALGGGGRLSVSTSRAEGAAVLAVEVAGLATAPAAGDALERGLADALAADPPGPLPSLAGARALARLAGGDVDVSSAPDGWRAVARVPVKA